MAAVAEAFKGLGLEPIERVLDWANKHYLKRSAKRRGAAREFQLGYQLPGVLTAPQRGEASKTSPAALYAI
jgi:hypothetical protein